MILIYNTHTGSIWGHFNAFMNDIEEKLMNNLNDLLENNIEAINVRIFGTRDRKSVQIIIESKDGITVESCSRYQNCSKYH